MDHIFGSSGICLGYDRSTTATQEMPVATPPIAPSKGRVVEEERRSGTALA
jgi:hypothetical protein